jgi:hypothetical protein
MFVMSHDPAYSFCRFFSELIYKSVKILFQLVLHVGLTIKMKNYVT